MPIKPENAARYPKDWKAIRARILERAHNCCEGSPKYPDCRVVNGSFRFASSDPDLAKVRIVLTIAHLDHQPENCEDSNLRAWCQKCHLAYDLKHHAETAYATRHARRAIGDLFA